MLFRIGCWRILYVGRSPIGATPASRFNRGERQFGDMFGTANALFSGLAFAAIYASLRAQHDEIAEQQRNSTKQAQLTALTAYAELTKTLWIRNSDRQLREPSEEHSRAEGERYVEMMRARSALEAILKDGNVLGS